MQRTRSMVMSQSGIMSAVSIIRETLRNPQPPPPQVILVLDSRKRAYSRDRLATMHHYEIYRLFKTDFDPSLQLGNMELLMTFHSDIPQPPVLMDGNSWKDLLQTVTKVECHRLKTTRITRAQVGYFCLFLLHFIIVFAMGFLVAAWWIIRVRDDFMFLFFMFLFTLALLDDDEVFKPAKSGRAQPRFTESHQAYY
ncbi:hypothetical protein BDN72DRAFT_962245 [Pluteus cervinus]|uniref:Uncharacterized protein n=1 Tax=Pluteus cervinus TaxID=181527 RepID=A0ACD3AJV1_9AGAR|nr:hypothetical protein BDN72DRAFT_962245 [Pluteus cervinus]